VDLILNQISDVRSQMSDGSKKKPIIVDPLVKNGKPSMACKAWQMLALKNAGIEVPKSVYGSLWYLYESMKSQISDLKCQEDKIKFDFPVILKGSGGDRGTRVFKADNLEQLEKLVRDLRKSETEEGRRYMLQEYIPNDGDYRVLVLGEKVLGVMKRSSQSKDEFKNNYSVGGKVEIAELPKDIKQLAVKAAKICGLAVAGVDVMAKKISDVRCQMSDKTEDYVILEVNKGPQFKGFMKATGIDVPAEIVKYLVSLAQSP
jgi:RimK family alpha-L-glutamate ligase